MMSATIVVRPAVHQDLKIVLLALRQVLFQEVSVLARLVCMFYQIICAFLHVLRVRLLTP